MNVLNAFLSMVTDEFGEKINFSNIENEGFAGVVCLNERSADIIIEIDQFTEFDNDLNNDEKKMLNAFVEYTQSQMKDQKQFSQNITNTQKQLYI